MKAIVKIVRENFFDDSSLEKNPGRDAFFEGLQPELFEAVCRGLDAPFHPMALVSEQLMVMRQTETCRNLLEEGTFYSIESVLRPEECRSIRESIRTNTEHTISVVLQGERRSMRIIPAAQGALLVFQNDVQHQVGVTIAAAHLRQSAGNLMMLAEQLQQEESGMVRREALRILRQVNHVQMLSGAPELLHVESCSVQGLLARAEQQLKRLGVALHVHRPEKDVHFWADEGMLLSAVMTLVSNSLRHGGTDVRISLRAEAAGNNVLLRVDDNGVGLSEQALGRMNDTWRRPDAVLGSWGLGIPYARRIAELHGGTLMFAQSEENGCAARIRLPIVPPEESGLESACGYSTDLAEAACPAEIELSGVLQPEAFATR